MDYVIQLNWDRMRKRPRVMLRGGAAEPAYTKDQAVVRVTDCGSVTGTAVVQQAMLTDWPETHTQRKSTFHQWSEVRYEDLGYRKTLPHEN